MIWASVHPFSFPSVDFTAQRHTESHFLAILPHPTQSLESSTDAGSHRPVMSVPGSQLLAWSLPFLFRILFDNADRFTGRIYPPQIGFRLPTYSCGLNPRASAEELSLPSIISCDSIFRAWARVYIYGQCCVCFNPVFGARRPHIVIFIHALLVCSPNHCFETDTNTMILHGCPKLDQKLLALGSDGATTAGAVLPVLYI